jgi:hypothetical protein
MSVASAFRAKSQFRIMYKVLSVHGRKVEAPWRDYGVGDKTYVEACERVEQLNASPMYGHTEYAFKQIHKKLVNSKGESR